MEVEELKAACLQVGIVLAEEEISHILSAIQDHKQRNLQQNTEPLRTS